MSEKNFSYCEWPYFLQEGGHNWLKNPNFEWRDEVESFKGVREPIVSSRVKEIRSRTVSKILSTPKKEKKNWTDSFFQFHGIFVYINKAYTALFLHWWQYFPNLKFLLTVSKKIFTHSEEKNFYSQWVKNFFLTVSKNFLHCNNFFLKIFFIPLPLLEHYKRDHHIHTYLFHNWKFLHAKIFNYETSMYVYDDRVYNAWSSH